MVKKTDFIKYTRLSLSCEDKILTFYKNVQAQGMTQNVILVPCQDITPSSGILNINLSKDTGNVIDTALNTKFLEDSVISKDFTKAHDLLAST